MMISMKFHILDMWCIIFQRGHSLKNPVCTSNLLLNADLSAHLHQPHTFYRPDALPAAQPTVPKHQRQLAHSD